MPVIACVAPSVEASAAFARPSFSNLWQVQRNPIRSVWDCFFSLRALSETVRHRVKENGTEKVFRVKREGLPWKRFPSQMSYSCSWNSSVSEEWSKSQRGVSQTRNGLSFRDREKKVPYFAKCLRCLAASRLALPRTGLGSVADGGGGEDAEEEATCCEGSSSDAGDVLMIWGVLLLDLVA